MASGVPRYCGNENEVSTGRICCFFSPFSFSVFFVGRTESSYSKYEFVMLHRPRIALYTLLIILHFLRVTALNVLYS